MLKFKTTTFSNENNLLNGSNSSLNQQNCSFISSEFGYSKANLLLKNVSIPLAWPVEEYFGNKKEWREFTLQLVVRSTDGKEIYSKPLERINRTITDVDFNDNFYFSNQSPEFCLEVILYCKRTDENAPYNLVQTLSKSVGRSLGLSLKRYIQSANNTINGSTWYHDNTTSAANNNNLNDSNLENYRNPEKMCALGSAKFHLRNATLSGRIYTYNLELVPHGTYPGIGRAQLLPIYGNICAQFLCQPVSLMAPLAQSILDIFFVEGGILLQNMHCILKGAQLKCYEEKINSDETITKDIKKSVLALPIDQNSSIEPTAFQTSIKLKLFDEQANKFQHYILIASSHNAYFGWKNALNLQILDCSIWADFAMLQKNPHGANFSNPSGFNESAIFNLNDLIPKKSKQQRSQQIKEPFYSTIYANTLKDDEKLVNMDENNNLIIKQQQQQHKRMSSSISIQTPPIQRLRSTIITNPHYKKPEYVTTFPSEEPNTQPMNIESPETNKRYVISLNIGLDDETKPISKINTLSAKDVKKLPIEMKYNTYEKNLFDINNSKILRRMTQPLPLPRAQFSNNHYQNLNNNNNNKRNFNETPHLITHL